MDDEFSFTDALNDKVGVMGLAGGAAGLKSLAGVRQELESLKALLAKEADERRMQSFLREKLHQFRQQLDRIGKLDSAMQRYVEAMALQEVFKTAAITTSMMNELADKQYLTALQEDLVAATCMPKHEPDAGRLIPGYVLSRSLPLLLKVQHSAEAIKQDIASLEDDLIALPEPVSLIDALKTGEPRLLRASFLACAAAFLLLAIAVAVSGYLNKRVLSVDGNLAFGNAPIGQDTIRPIALTNKGTQPLTIRSITFPEGFGQTHHWSGTIAAGQSQTIDVVFHPQNERHYSGGLTVFSDATRTEAIQPLSGDGITPTATITTSTGAKELTFLPANIGRSQRESLVIENTGPGVYSCTISCPNGFMFVRYSWETFSWEILGQRLAVDVSSGKTKRVELQFEPQREGSYDGDIVIQPKAHGPSHRIPVRATAMSLGSSSAVTGDQ